MYNQHQVNKIKAPVMRKIPSGKKTLFGDPTVSQQKRLFDMAWDQIRNRYQLQNKRVEKGFCIFSRGKKIHFSMVEVSTCAALLTV